MSAGEKGIQMRESGRMLCIFHLNEGKVILSKPRGKGNSANDESARQDRNGGQMRGRWEARFPSELQNDFEAD